MADPENEACVAFFSLHWLICNILNVTRFGTGRQFKKAKQAYFNSENETYGHKCCMMSGSPPVKRTHHFVTGGIACFRVVSPRTRTPPARDSHFRFRKFLWVKYLVAVDWFVIKNQKASAGDVWTDILAFHSIGGPVQRCLCGHVGNQTLSTAFLMYVHTSNARLAVSVSIFS
jgi:hypothetical protein